MTTLVFVAGAGLAKDKGDSLWLMRQKRAVKKASAVTRPLLGKADAEALLGELTADLPPAGKAPSPARAAEIASRSLDARELARTLRALCALTPQREADLETRLTLQQHLGDELAAALGVEAPALPDFVLERKKARKRHGPWLAALNRAGVTGEVLERKLPCLRVEPPMDLYGTWRSALEALLPLKLYPVITSEETRGLDEPDTTVKGHAELTVPKAKRWPAHLNHGGVPVLAVLPVTAPWLAAQVLRIGGVNGTPEPAAHAKQHRAWFGAHGAMPVIVEDLSMDLVVPRPPRGKRVAAVVKEQLAYCEDLRLMTRPSHRAFAKVGYWGFWWD